MAIIKENKTSKIIWALVFGVPETSAGWGSEYKYIIALYSAVILGPAIGYTYGALYQKNHKLLSAGKGLVAAWLLYRVWIEFDNPKTFSTVKGIIFPHSVPQQPVRKPGRVVAIVPQKLTK